MKAKSKRKVEACKRSLRHIVDHPLTPPNARLTALVTEMTAEVASFRDYSAGQAGGGAEFHSGTMTRRESADALRSEMRTINQMAKALPREQYPGVRELFLMPRSGSYEALIASANAFLEKIGPIKSVFVERGLPADFDEQLAGKLATVDTASDTRDSGRSDLVGGTAGLDAKADHGIVLLREMDSILSYQYRNDPALLASGKSASHVDRDPSRAEEEEEGDGTGSGTAPLAMAAVPPAGEPDAALAVEPRLLNGNGNGNGAVTQIG